MWGLKPIASTSRNEREVHAYSWLLVVFLIVFCRKRRKKHHGICNAHCKSGSMNSHPCSSRAKAFTLVELLTVIAIIAILAALLLPALNRSEMRGKRVWCINNLSQSALAFHAFANDHSGKFPMAVSTNDGGSLEYVESGFSSGRTFYTAFHHFAVLANELALPRTLVCPADWRPEAANFAVLLNSNVSYFVGVSATFDNPQSILAGDRNLATNSWIQPTILELGPASTLRWTSEMHQHNGNVLFADGHVEQWNKSSFNSDEDGSSENQSLFLPSVPPIDSLAGAPGGPGYGSGYGSSAAGGGPSYSGNSYSSTQSNASPSAGVRPNQASISQSVNNPNYSRAPTFESGAPSANTSPTAASQAYPATDVSGDVNSGMSDFNLKLTRIFQGTIVGGFSLLWLLLLLYLAYRWWKWRRQREAQLRAKMSMTTAEPSDADDDVSSGRIT